MVGFMRLKYLVRFRKILFWLKYSLSQCYRGVRLCITEIIPLMSSKPGTQPRNLEIDRPIYGKSFLSVFSSSSTLDTQLTILEILEGVD